MWFVYHFIVRQIVNGAFAQISSGRTQNVASKFSADAVLRFSGTHALGGERRGRAEIGAWFARLSELFPYLRLTPLAIVVNGGPWNTTVATRFRVQATLPGAIAYENEGMQYLRLRWGSIVEDRLYEDTALLASAIEAIERAA